MVVTMCASIFYLGVMSNRVDQNAKTIAEIKTQYSATPTRIEFDALILTVDEIRKDVKTLITQK
ncbi:MAG: hypothetical protein C4519_24420 [Desulfobacteraceae bacterium]|nr:MAG: hypothetical protein C4519_24420 [Desulfobacteraceae bacterium]